MNPILRTSRKEPGKSIRSAEFAVNGFAGPFPGAFCRNNAQALEAALPFLDKSTCGKIRHIKKCVLQMLKERASGDRSNMWEFSCEKFQYLLGLEEKYYAQLRIHTYHLDNDSYVLYKSDANHRKVAELQWRRLAAKIPKDYFEGEPKCAGEFGYEVGGCLVNKNTIRNYAVIKTLYERGISSSLCSADSPKVLEIGAGYGGLTYHLSRIIRKAQYFIVDLPETLLFPAAYLTMTCPERSLYLYDPQDRGAVPLTGFEGYDFVLLPNYALHHLNELRFQLAINVGSFQEMNCEQLAQYLDFLKPRLSGVLYSQNQDSHARNSSPINVTKALRQRFAIEEVRGVKAFSPMAVLLTDPSRLLDLRPRTLLSYFHKKLSVQERHTVNHEYLCRPLS